MADVNYESKLRSVVRSSMHPCQRNSLSIGRAVVYYGWSFHSFSEGIKCWYCTSVGCFPPITCLEKCAVYDITNPVQSLFPKLPKQERCYQRVLSTVLGQFFFLVCDWLRAVDYVD